MLKIKVLSVLLAQSMVHANALFAACGTTIFETMSRLANRHGAINLGQGFPEGLEPEALIERLAQSDRDGPHQYPSMMGVPELRDAIAAHETRTYGLTTESAQVMVTSGGTEALAASFFGLIEPGDEVVLMEPLYDSYLPIIQRAGGIPRIVRLNPPDWSLPREALAAAFGPKTRLLVLNSPNNPSGKVFDAEELAFIAGLLERHDCLAICDEVYEHLCYDQRSHLPLRTVPGMAGRAVKIGSAGKIFSLTGWKVGWVIAAPEILEPIAKAHQYLTFTTAPTLQRAVAWGLNDLADYYNVLATTLAGRRDRLSRGLERSGFSVLPTGGSYFLNADFRPLGYAADDLSFCTMMTEQAGVAAIPVSAFYPKDGPSHLARFCFAKTDDAITEATRRLEAFFADR